MTDTAEGTANEAPESPAASPEIQQALENIRAEREAAIAKAAAAAQAEEERVAALNAAKARCAAECGPVTAALAAADDPAERAALVELEARTHANHAADLERAYLVFAGQREGDSNPSGPQGALTSSVAVAADTSAT